MYGTHFRRSGEKGGAGGADRVVHIFYGLPLPADTLCSKLKCLSVRTSDKRKLFLDRD
jgi:hypothetical protein